MHFLPQARGVSDGCNRLMCFCTALLGAGFTLLIFTTVLSRYVFNFSILFSQEVSKLLFIWCCFFAATIAYKRAAHVRFEFAGKLLGARGVLATDVLIHLLSLAFFGLVLVESVSFVRQIWATYFPLIGISQGWLYLSVTLSAVVFIVHGAAFLLESLESLKDRPLGDPLAPQGE